MLERTVLIIYPHWHPVNLAGVHRPRLVGNYLKEHGWIPRVLTVESAYFEEPPDPDFEKTFSRDFVITRVKAFRVTHPRIIGDIGLRAFIQLRKEAIRIIMQENIHFIWIPIPSFYMALMGRLLHRKVKIPYGIDYIDPWIRDISNRRNLRSVSSQLLATLLEPFALKKASLISGVSQSYYLPAIKRNHLQKRQKAPPVKHVAFPYGFDPADHRIRIDQLPLPWKDPSKKIWLYAGAFLPGSHLFLKMFFKAIAALCENGDQNPMKEVQLYFIGTGQYSYTSIEAYAEEYGLGEMVYEIRDRLPYLHTLNYLSEANTILILGSTEAHYTASKTYQALLSGTPVISVFHEESQACQVMQECGADRFTVRYAETMSERELESGMKQVIINRLSSSQWNPDLDSLQPYHAREAARKLAAVMDQCIKDRT